MQKVKNSYLIKPQRLGLRFEVIGTTRLTNMFKFQSINLFISGTADDDKCEEISQTEWHRRFLKGFYIVECVLKKTACLLLAILPFTVHHALKP